MKKYVGVLMFLALLWLMPARMLFAQPVIPDTYRLVPGGTFVMGDTFGDGELNERPVREVTLDPFYLASCELSAEEAAELLNLGLKNKTVQVKKGIVSCTQGNKEPLVDLNGNDMGGLLCPVQFSGGKFSVRKGEERKPMNFLTWYGAAILANLASLRDGRTPFYDQDTWIGNPSADGYRMPSEAEWEYAARAGGKPILYSWGDGNPQGNISDKTVYETFKAQYWFGYEDGYLFTAPVGSFEPNAFGLHDMTGNVREWCHWMGNYNPEAGQYPFGVQWGSGSGVLRGGDWLDSPKNLRVTRRYGYSRDSKNGSCGVRLLLPDLHKESAR
jgi:formylglycine-generating enzyme required for sulfatase activity